MLYAGLDLSRKRLDFHLLDGEGATVDVGASPPDVDGLRGLTQRLERHGAPIRAAIESMNGARFVHDRLELHGWQVEIADAQKVKGLAPLACKTDRIDAWVLAELARRDLVPAIWLPEPWQGTIDASLRLIDELDREINECERELRWLGAGPLYVPLLLTGPG